MDIPVEGLSFNGRSSFPGEITNARHGWKHNPISVFPAVALRPSRRLEVATRTKSTARAMH